MEKFNSFDFPDAQPEDVPNQKFMVASMQHQVWLATQPMLPKGHAKFSEQKRSREAAITAGFMTESDAAAIDNGMKKFIIKVTTTDPVHPIVFLKSDESFCYVFTARRDGAALYLKQDAERILKEIQENAKLKGKTYTCEVVEL